MLVFTDRSPVVRALVDQFRRAGLDVIMAIAGHALQSPPAPTDTRSTQGNADDAAALLAALREAGRSPRRIVFAWPLEDASIEAGFLSLLALSQAMGSEELSQVQLTVLTTGAARVTGDEATDPRLGTLVGAVRVIPTELPGIGARLVDVPVAERASPRLTELLLAELVASDHDVVALRGPRPVDPVAREHAARSGDDTTVPRRRRVPHYRRLRRAGARGGAAPGACAWRAHRAARPARRCPHAAPGTHWITSHDAQDETTRRILMVRELEAAGASVLPVEADVTDARGAQDGDRPGASADSAHCMASSMRRARWTMAHCRCALQKSAQRVLAPKVQGTLALEEALRGSKLDFIVLFSSISALTGLPGQFDYAAANAFLDAWSQRQFTLGGTRVVSINWAPWSDVGMAASLASAMGVSAPLTGEPTGHPLLARRVQLSLREQAYPRHHRAGDALAPVGTPRARRAADGAGDRIPRPGLPGRPAVGAHWSGGQCATSSSSIH